LVINIKFIVKKKEFVLISENHYNVSG
jgi:hypothetical protein